MTSKILFKDVIIALKEHAFQRNPYPLILSFENHCDLRAQQKVAEILKSEIGDMIYTIPENSHDIEYFPSPESLKNKFVIKGKGILVDKARQPEQQAPSSPEQITIQVKGICNGTEQAEEQTPVKAEAIDHYSIITEGDSSLESPGPTANNNPKSFFEEIVAVLFPAKKVDSKTVYDDDSEFARKKNNNIEKTFNSEKPLNFKNPLCSMSSFAVGCKPPTRISTQNITFYALNKNYDDWIITEDSFENDEENKVANKVEGLQNTTYFSTRPRFMSPTPSAKTLKNTEQNKSHLVSEKAFTGPQQGLLSNPLKPPKSEKHIVKVCPDLNRFYSMIGCKMSFHNPRKIWEISSLDENKVVRLYKKHQKIIVDFHKKFLTRIYPSGSRFDSSNYDPIIPWASGSQMVALNVQTHDEAMLINYAKFASNGRTGYVLKPSYLRHESIGEKNQPIYPQEMTKPLKQLTIRIISGQQIRPDNYKSKEIIDPYVEVKIRGLEVDETNNASYRTQTIKDNGFHPVWAVKENSNTFKFCICAPDFCFLVFNVYDEDLVSRERVGWYAIEFNNILQGYRVIPILNNHFLPIKHSYIFCHISIEDLILTSS